MEKKMSPSMDQWLREAKADSTAAHVGMYLIHNGTVRQSAKARVRQGQDVPDVKGMYFTYDQEKVASAVAEAYQMEGVYYIRTWLNEGNLELGDDIMYVLIGGDIRPRIVNALNFLVGKLKEECVTEIEMQ